MPGTITRDDVLALLAVSHFGACATSPEGTFVFWNRRAEQILGLPAAQVIGRRYDDVIDTPAAPRHRTGEAAEPSAPTGRPALAPLTATMRNGSGEHVQIALTPVVVADQPDNDTLTLYLFDAPTDQRLPDPGGQHTPEPAPAGPEAAPPSADHRPRPPQRALSRRELQILRLVAASASTEQIAADLGISVHTVRNHVRGLRRKLDAKTKLDAVVTAMRHGLI